MFDSVVESAIDISKWDKTITWLGWYKKSKFKTW